MGQRQRELAHRIYHVSNGLELSNKLDPSIPNEIFLTVGITGVIGSIMLNIGTTGQVAMALRRHEGTMAITNDISVADAGTDLRP